MRAISFLIISCFALYTTSSAQPASFQIVLEPLSITELGGLHSFAWGQHNSKWLIVGGRLDGLHRRQPFAAFDKEGNNNQIIVVDPVAKQKWTAPLSSLSAGLQEQLSSTNMEFFQEGDYLYMTGGYGYSKTAADHITYPNITAAKVSDLIDAVINGKLFASSFRQITDTMFAVTGGYLNKIGQTFYLTGGQKFNGRYNPMGPNHGPGFSQTYTNSSRKFKIKDDGTSLEVTHLPALTDPVNLHRRDYNVVPQIMPSVEEGLTAFSGVFQEGADLPFLNCVNIESTGFTVDNAFSQYYNHYHCAYIPLYSASRNEMHSIFFGGIAQYFDDLGTLVQDNNVPFVRTIARVTRDANGKMAEYKLPIEMPALLGAGSEFIAMENIPKYSNGVLKLDEFNADSTLVGYIYGGISSTAVNVFFNNTVNKPSTASNQLFKVYVIRISNSSKDILNEQSIGTLKMKVYPNLNNGVFNIRFNNQNSTAIKLEIRNASGKLIKKEILTNLPTGGNLYSRKIKGLVKAGVYYISIETATEKASQKITIDS